MSNTPDGEAVHDGVNRASARAPLGAWLSLAASIAVSSAGAGFAYAAYRYQEVIAALGSLRLEPIQAFSVLAVFLADYGPDFARVAALAASVLAALALAQLLTEMFRRKGAEHVVSGRIGRARGSKTAAAFVASLAMLAVSLELHWALHREWSWTESAAVAGVAVGATFGALRDRHPSPPRLPRALMPVTLAMSSFLFGAADCAARWSTAGAYLQWYKGGTPIPHKDVLVVRSRRPVGAVVFVDPALVLVAFGVWAWAAGPRPKGPRNVGPAVLGATAAIVVIGYAGMNWRVRKDLATYTQGTGSNEDILSYVQVNREPPPPQPPPGWNP